MAILPEKPQELGRIRSGDQIEWMKDGKTAGTRPHKLECFRLTSQIKPRLDYAARMPEYGGEVSAWPEAPGGSQWQLYTAQKSIPVMVPPFNALSQHNEIWQGGECARRCNGDAITSARDAALVGQECLCQSMGIDERLAKAKLSKAEACNTITRLSLMMPDLPGVGIWLYSTKSYYAGMELQGNADMLQQASAEGVFISAMLSIEERRVVRGGQTKVFPVVTLQAEVTMRQLLTRELPEDKHIRVGVPVPQLAVAPEEPEDVIDGQPSYPPDNGAFAERSSEPVRPSVAPVLTAPEPDEAIPFGPPWEKEEKAATLGEVTSAKLAPQGDALEVTTREREAKENDAIKSHGEQDKKTKALQVTAKSVVLAVAKKANRPERDVWMALEEGKHFVEDVRTALELKAFVEAAKDCETSLIEPIDAPVETEDTPA